MNRRLLIIIGVVLLIVLIALLGYVLTRPKTPTNEQITINYWGLWDSPDVYKELFAQYEKDNPNVKIAYSQKQFGNVTPNYSYKGQYQITADERLKSGEVDILQVHNTWLPRIKDNLAPAPVSIFSERSVKSDYYPAIYEAITTTKGEVYAAPFYIDGVVLFYNKDLFAKASISKPPVDWDEVETVAKKLTITQNGEIVQAGINLGAATNSSHAFENVLLMMTQANVKVVDTDSTGKIVASFADKANTEETAAAINRFLGYNTSFKFWSPRMENDLKAFADGKLAMMLAPSWRANDIISYNSKLNFDMAPVPILQQANKDTPQYLASYWVNVVSKTSKNSGEAWKLLGWLSKPEQLRKIYAAEKKQRLFGGAYPLTSMQNELSDAPYASVLIQMAPRMKSWPMYDYGAWEESFDTAISQWELKGTVDSNDLNALQKSINSSVFTK